MATDPREHALRTLLVEAVRVLVPDLTELERLIGRVSPAAWAELPRQVGHRRAIELVVKHAIENEWNDALVGELERIAPRNDVVVDLRALLTPDAQPYRGDTVTGLGRRLEGWRPRIEHALQPALHFKGRRALLVTLGGYAHLAALQEYVRGRRILEQIVGGRLAGQGELDAARLKRLALDTPDVYALLRELGHYALAMGELDHAEQLYDRAREIFVLETQTIG